MAKRRQEPIYDLERMYLDRKEKARNEIYKNAVAHSLNSSNK